MKYVLKCQMSSGPCGPIFESRGLVGPPFHKFRSITDRYLTYLSLIVALRARFCVCSNVQLQMRARVPKNRVFANSIPQSVSPTGRESQWFTTSIYHLCVFTILTVRAKSETIKLRGYSIKQWSQNITEEN